MWGWMWNKVLCICIFYFCYMSAYTFYSSCRIIFVVDFQCHHKISILKPKDTFSWIKKNKHEPASKGSQQQ